MHHLRSFLRFSLVLLVVLALAIGFAAGSVFVAYGAANDTYNACITSKGDIYRVRKNASWNCLSGDTKISWNQQGPQGPAGLNGNDGQDGDQGLPGASAQTNVTIREEANSIDGTSESVDTVTCEDGEVAIAGGFVPADEQLDVYARADGPSAGGWKFHLINDSDDTANITLYVSCLAP